MTMERWKIRSRRILALLLSVLMCAGMLNLTALAGYEESEEPEDGACDHQWGKWEVIKEPGCEADGLEEHACQECGETETRPVAGGHSWQAEEETEDGVWYVCTVCQETDFVETPSADEEETDVVVDSGEDEALTAFLTALDAMGDAMDTESTLAALDAIEAAYARLSEDEKATVADQWAYIQNYAAQVREGSFDVDVDTMDVTAGSVAKVIKADSTETGYDTLKAAIAAAQDGDTVTVLQNCNAGTVKIENGRNVTVDLNGTTVGKANFRVNGGSKLTVTGTGTLDAYTTFYVFQVDEGTVTVDKDVNVNSAQGYAMFVVAPEGKRSVANVYGKVRAYNYAISDNASANKPEYGGITEINIYPGAEVHSDLATAIFAPDDKNIINITGGTVSGLTAIEIRGGELNISGDAVITGDYVVNGGYYGYDLNGPSQSGNGQTGHGFGILVSQHSTKAPVAVNISGGTISGYVGLFQRNMPQTDVNNVTLKIEGGTIRSNRNGREITDFADWHGTFDYYSAPYGKDKNYPEVKAEAVTSQDYTGFISGGTFSSDVTEYCVEGMKQNLSGEVVDKDTEGPSFGDVAEVDGTYYKDLAKAIAAVNEATEETGQTIEILGDITVDTWTQMWNIDGVTINGNNHTLTVGNVVSNGNGSRLVYGAENFNVSDLTVVEKAGGGIFDLNSGKLSNVAFYCDTWAVLPGSGVTIENCEFNPYTESADSPGIYNDNAETANFTVRGCTFNTKRAVVLYGSNVVFTNNTMGENCTSGVTVFSSATNATISGNTFAAGSRLKVYPGAKIDVNTIGFAELDSGVNSLESAITSAQKLTEVKVPAGKHLVEVENQDGTYSYYLGTGIAKIGDATYNTLQAAINAAGETASTVTLLNDTVESVTIKAGQNITLDLNGKKLEGSDPKKGDAEVTGEDNPTHTIINKGTLTIKDSAGNGCIVGMNRNADVWNSSASKFERKVKPYMALQNDATCTIESGMITRAPYLAEDEEGKVQNNTGVNSNYTIRNNGTMTISGGEIKNNSQKSAMVSNNGIMTISGGALDSANYTAVQNQETSTLTIKGGTIKGGTTSPCLSLYGTTNIEDGADVEGWVQVWAYDFYNKSETPVHLKSVLNINGGKLKDTQLQCVNGLSGYDPTAKVEEANNKNVYCLWGTGGTTATININGGELDFSGGIITCKIVNTEAGNGRGMETVKNGDVSTIWVKGGSFATPVPLEYCATGYLPIANGDGTYGVSNGNLVLTPSDTSMTGSGTVTLRTTIDGKAVNATVTCNNNVSVTGSNGTYTASLPNRNAAYIFTASFGGKTTTCQVSVTYRSSGTGGGGGGGGSYRPSSRPSGGGSTVIEDPDVPLAQPFLFTDVSEGIWYYEGVKYAFDKSMMTGLSETIFAPNDTTTRGMIVTILYRLEGSPKVETPASFTDVEAGKYYADPIAWASANGVVKGYDGNVFKPNAPITREQMAAILYRYASFKGYDVTKLAELSAYADVDSVSTYAMEAMQWANAAELITGSDSKLLPQGDAVRAQVAVILMRFCENVAK